MNRVLARAEDWTIAALMAIMIAIVFAAVVLRYAFNSPIGWSDELAKIAFTWLVFLGGAVGVRRGAHIGIDAVVVILPSGFRRLVALVADLLVVLILLVFVYYGVLLAQMTAAIVTPSLRLPVGFVYSAAPLGAFLMLLHQLGHVASTYFGHGAGRGTREAEPS